MRQLIWIKTAKLEAWGCSSCAWIFQPSGPPVGDDLEEMKRNFERQRDREYASHVCTQYPKERRVSDEPLLSRKIGERAAARRTTNSEQIRMNGAL